MDGELWLCVGECPVMEKVGCYCENEVCEACPSCSTTLVGQLVCVKLLPLASGWRMEVINRENWTDLAMTL